MIYFGDCAPGEDMGMTNKQTTSPNWKLGMAAGTAIGLGFGTAIGDLLLGVSLALCFGVALSYAFGAKDAQRAEQAEQG